MQGKTIYWTMYLRSEFGKEQEVPILSTLEEVRCTADVRNGREDFLARTHERMETACAPKYSITIEVEARKGEDSGRK
jgi:hypothetical protein